MLQLTLVVEDAKISLEELEEEIQEIEDYVQSTDIAGESSFACRTSFSVPFMRRDADSQP
jgi:elongation factor 1-beta